jgi:hypothetical protein
MFTNGDLSTLNILVRSDKINGIVDWETAGWVPSSWEPSYWEYSTACQVNSHTSFWLGEVDMFLDSQHAGLEMGKIRLRYFGEYCVYQPKSLRE